MAREIEEELIELEKQYWQALRHRDVSAAVALTDFPCIVAGPQGVASIDARTFSSMMEDSSYALEHFDLHDVQVRMLGNDVAVVGYKVTEALTVGGKPVQLEAADTSTWIRRDGRWVCAQHSEAILGDPFGRDRTAVAQG